MKRVSGLTLVELAVAILVVGLLIAGAAGAMGLRTRIGLLATVSDVQTIGAATAVFVDRYGALPGDLADAAAKIPNCDATRPCGSIDMTGSSGDGDVGNRGAITRHQTAGGTQAEFETVLFWSHLLLTDLIGELDQKLSSEDVSSIAWGTSHPSAPVGGGFHVKDANGGVEHPLPGWPPGAQQPSGTFLVLQPKVSEDLVPARAGSQVLNSSQAIWIDRKIDDGNPFDGYVVGYGTTTTMLAGAGCISWTSVDRGFYDEASRGRSCGLAFRIAP